MDTLKKQLDRIWETGYCLNPNEPLRWYFRFSLTDLVAKIPACLNIFAREEQDV